MSRKSRRVSRSGRVKIEKILAFGDESTRRCAHRRSVAARGGDAGALNEALFAGALPVTIFGLEGCLRFSLTLPIGDHIQRDLTRQAAGSNTTLCLERSRGAVAKAIDSFRRTLGRQPQCAGEPR